MNSPGVILKSFLAALATFAYVAAVAWTGFHAQAIFGTNGKADTFLAPLFMLLLFVISALITGLLVLGKPIHLYMNGAKKEAFTMLFATLGWLVLFLFGVVIKLILLK